MTQFIQNFMKYRPLLSELVSRDIKIKYRRSVLGVLWTLLNPLCMMIVLSIVFSNLFKFGMENFPVYLLSGQLIFNFYSDVTTSSMSAIINNASLIKKKIYIPKYLFVVSRVISSIINLCASFCAMIIVMVALKVETSLYSIIGLDSDAAVDGFLIGSRTCVVCNYCKIQGYYAFIFCFRNSIDVSDSGDLSNESFTGKG